jgi:hypothetical protein
VRDQPPVPSQNRVRLHDGRHLPQQPASRQAAALLVIQPHPPAAQLSMEDFLLHQIVDHFLLVALDPSSQSHEQKPEG